MNIPDEVIDAAVARYYEHAPIITVADARVAHTAAYLVVAVWARKEALRPIVAYLNHCGILRVEPTTAGLRNALAKVEQS